MQYCGNCKLNIRDNKKNCPLCQNPLPKAEDSQKIFPNIAIRYNSHLALKILIFISITIIVASFTVHMLYPVSVNWPRYVLSIIASMWIILAVAIRKRHNIPKNVMWQVAIISLISVFWDWSNGFSGWSIDYVIPLVCVAAMVVLIITANIMHISSSAYLFYLLLDVIYGFLPVAFILFDWVDVLYPSIICIAVSLISLSALLLFEGQNIIDELKKRMHL